LGLGIIVIVNDGRWSLSADAVTRTKVEAEVCSSGLGPHVNDDPVGQNLVVADTPVGFDRFLERFAMDIGPESKKWSSNLRVQISNLRTRVRNNGGRVGM